MQGSKALHRRPSRSWLRCGGPWSPCAQQHEAAPLEAPRGGPPHSPCTTEWLWRVPRRGLARRRAPPRACRSLVDTPRPACSESRAFSRAPGDPAALARAEGINWSRCRGMCAWRLPPQPCRRLQVAQASLPPPGVACMPPQAKPSRLQPLPCTVQMARRRRSGTPVGRCSSPVVLGCHVVALVRHCPGFSQEGAVAQLISEPCRSWCCQVCMACLVCMAAGSQGC